MILDGEAFTVPNHWFWPQFEQGWEPETEAFFRANLVAGTDYLDVGGWIGPTALIATRLGARKVKVVEPNPVNFLHLLITQIRNPGFFAKWSLVNACVSGTRGFASIGPLQGILNGSSATNIREKEGAEILSILLEDLFKADETYSLIKIDIEGAEEGIVEQIAAIHTSGAAIWLSLHPPFLADKTGFCRRIRGLEEAYVLTDANNRPMDWDRLESMILSDEAKPSWGTQWGNFFEVGLLPKSAYDANGSRIPTTA